MGDGLQLWTEGGAAGPREAGRGRVRDGIEGLGRVAKSRPVVITVDGLIAPSTSDCRGMQERKEPISPGELE